MTIRYKQHRSFVTNHPLKISGGGDRIHLYDLGKQESFCGFDKDHDADRGTVIEPLNNLNRSTESAITVHGTEAFCVTCLAALRRQEDV